MPKSSLAKGDARHYDPMARLFNLLSNPERLRLIALLEENEKDVSALQQATGMSISSVSQHLKSLREAGIVTFRRQGKYRIYRLANPAITNLVTHARMLNHTGEPDNGEDTGASPERMLLA